MDGTSLIPGGWLNRHYIQLGYQAALGFAGLGYSLVISVIILWVVNRIPGLRLTVDTEDQPAGVDTIEVGEIAYEHVHQGIDSDTTHDGIIADRGADVF